DSNPWAEHVPRERLEPRGPVEVLATWLGARQGRAGLERPLMVRFGDISRIEAAGRDLTVTLKSGTVIELDRFEADDFADGLRVWDRHGGVVELGEWPVTRVEFLATPPLPEVPNPLRGTVYTARGSFTGLVQWDRTAALGSDLLLGRTKEGMQRLRFDAIDRIERAPDGRAVVLLSDGREVRLGGTRATGDGHLGVYVDDARYGRVLVSWEAFERIEFDHGSDARAPGYEDFPPGERLRGRVRLADGSVLSGTIVYDLDESETTQTLDAPRDGVDYTIPFGLVAAIDAGQGERAVVRLHGGESVELEREGDLGPDNLGVLVFTGDAAAPVHVPWEQVRRIEFDRPSALSPPLPRQDD
ncbi:MAG: hypothetical protein R3323_08255, partial [Wenzhouxiangellaceae bacterium]|nr:hypothetical protein [Wenzhouxiangellaceae bacterium]